MDRYKNSNIDGLRTNDKSLRICFSFLHPPKIEKNAHAHVSFCAPCTLRVLSSKLCESIKNQCFVCYFPQKTLTAHGRRPRWLIGDAPPGRADVTRWHGVSILRPVFSRRMNVRWEVARTDAAGRHWGETRRKVKQYVALLRRCVYTRYFVPVFACKRNRKWFSVRSGQEWIISNHLTVTVRCAY